MQKISSDKIAEVLKDASAALLNVTSERDKLASQVSELLLQREVEKLASDMHEKGVRTDTAFDALVEDLQKAASEGRLDVIKEAVQLMAPDMGHSVSLREGAEGGSGASAFENYILGSIEN